MKYNILFKPKLEYVPFIEQKIKELGISCEVSKNYGTMSVGIERYSTYEQVRDIVNDISDDIVVPAYLTFLQELPSDAKAISATSFCIQLSTRNLSLVGRLVTLFDHFSENDRHHPYIIVHDGYVLICFYNNSEYEGIKNKIDSVCESCLSGHEWHISWTPFNQLALSIGVVQHIDAALDVPSSIETERKDNNDDTNHPSRYNRGGIECIDAMIAAKGIEKVKAFCECNEFKYNWRRGKKDPILKETKKSRWYLDKFVELEEKHPTEIIEVDGHKYLRLD